MSIQPIKTWCHEHLHMPRAQHRILHWSHIVHDSRFWVVLITGALIALFIILAILAGTGRPTQLPHSAYPYIY